MRKLLTVSHRRLHFTMGSVLPAESSVARFLARLCVIRNDIVLTQENVGFEFERGEATRPGVAVYFLFVAASHFREAAKILDEELQDPEIQTFVDTLSERVATFSIYGRVSASS